MTMFSTLDNFNYYLFKENILETFLLADRFLLMLVITLSLLLGIITYLKKYKTQIYLPIAPGILIFWVIKNSEKFRHNSAEERFLVIFLLIKFVGYIWFLAVENKSINIHVKFGILLILAFFKTLILIKITESLISQKVALFIPRICKVLDDGFVNLRYFVAYVIYVYELFNMPSQC